MAGDQGQDVEERRDYKYKKETWVAATSEALVLIDKYESVRGWTTDIFPNMWRQVQAEMI